MILSPVQSFAINLALCAGGVALFFAAAGSIAHKAASPLREALSKAAILVLALCPFIVVASTALNLGVIYPRAQTEPVVTKPSIKEQPRPSRQTFGSSQTLRAASSVSPEDNKPQQPKPQAPQTDYLNYALIAWLGIAVLGLSKLVVGRFMLIQIARTWQETEDEMLLDQVKNAAHHAGLLATPKLLVTANLTSPVCFVANGTTIGVPRDLSELLTKDQIRAAFLHECMHLKSEHQSWRSMTSIVSTLYWWILPVWLVQRQLEDAQEKICDSFVVQATQTGRDLAECLVALAARSEHAKAPHGAIAVFRRGQLEGRIRRLLDKGTNNMTKTTQRSLLAIGAVAAASIVLAAKLQVGSSKPEDLDFFPMVEGTKWTYAATFPDGQKQTWVREAWSRKSYKGMPVIEYRQYAEDYVDYEYLLFKGDGVYPMSRQYKDMPGFREQDPRNPQMKFPMTVGTTWTERSEVPYQTLSREGEPPQQRKAIYRDTDYKIVSDNDMIDTPLGRRKAVLIQVSTQESEGRNVLKIKNWICEGIGTVKQETYGQNGKLVQIVLLTNFQPGDPRNETPADQAALVRTKNSSLKSVANIVHRTLEQTYRSRFAVAESGNQRSIYRVSGTSVTPFDPMSPDAWNDLIDQELPKKRGMVMPVPAGYDAWQQLESIGLLCAVMQGHTLNAQTKSGQNEFTSSGSNTPTLGKTVIEGVDPDGKRWQVSLLVSFENDMVRSIEMK